MQLCFSLVAESFSFLIATDCWVPWMCQTTMPKIVYMSKGNTILWTSLCFVTSLCVFKNMSFKMLDNKDCIITKNDTSSNHKQLQCNVANEGIQWGWCLIMSTTLHNDGKQQCTDGTGILPMAKATIMMLPQQCNNGLLQWKWHPFTGKDILWWCLTKKCLHKNNMDKISSTSWRNNQIILLLWITLSHHHYFKDCHINLCNTYYNSPEVLKLVQLA